MDDAGLVGRLERLGDLSRDGQRLRAMRSDRSSPSTSSITRARTLPDSSNPWICATHGWLRTANVLASRSKRIRRSESLATDSGRIFSATVRSRRVSRAR
jgi:hypothetical protein